MTGRERRLSYEQQMLEKAFQGRDDISVEVLSRTQSGFANGYLVHYFIRSFSGVECVERFGEDWSLHRPRWADHFQMRIELPPMYPGIDAQPRFDFLTADRDGNPLEHPWHPNIRWFGPFAGHVCLNMPDSYTDLVWCVNRVAEYLRWERYHAKNEPPYPEDLQVSRWVENYYEKLF